MKIDLMATIDTDDLNLSPSEVKELIFDLDGGIESIGFTLDICKTLILDMVSKGEMSKEEVIDGIFNK
jgi:hypothetical protein